MTETRQSDDNPVLPEEPSNTTPTEETPTEEGEKKFSNGSWVRQVFTGVDGQKKISTTFIPDNPEEDAEREIEDYDDEDMNEWEQVLGDPQGINIDEGIAILRLDDEAEIVTATWLPDNEAAEIVRNTLKKTAEHPGEPTANLRDFRNCFRNLAGLRRVQRFRRCKHHLRS